MRLYPVATMVDRHLLAPARIGGWDLPAGTDVAACIYLTHRRPELCQDPSASHPSASSACKRIHLHPFGGGDHRCLGAAFATYEMRVVLAEVLSCAELGVAPGYRAPGYRARPVLPAVTVGPSGGMPVVLERRCDGRR